MAISRARSGISKGSSIPATTAITTATTTATANKDKGKAPAPTAAAAAATTTTTTTTKKQFFKGVTVPDNVKKIYKTIKKQTGAVGGYGHNGPVYGEITMGSMQKVINFLKENCGFTQDSSFVDIGAGLGKPNFHVAMDPGVKVSFGIEVEHLRWILSLKNLQALRASEKEMGGVVMLQRDITKCETLDPFSHIYMFDVGFPPDCMVSIANSFNLSKTAKNLICYKGPKYVIGKFGFEVRLIGQFSTSMCGSTESHMTYFYESTGGKRRQQTRISDSFRKTRPTNDYIIDPLNLKKKETKETKHSLPPPSKKRRIDSDTISTARKRTNVRGDDGEGEEVGGEGQQQQASPSDGLRIDPVVKASLDLLSNEGDLEHWMEDQLAQYFCGGRSRRSTRKLVST